MFLALSTEFLQGFWQGFFELIVLCIVAYFVNVLFARYSNRARVRQEIIDEVDQFVISLWKPRKLYTLLLEVEEKNSFLDQIASDELRAQKRYELHSHVFDSILQSIGRLRAVQIKLVTFFGFQEELLAHFTAIWMYLKEIRIRVERNETLFFGTPRKVSEGATKLGEDDLYVLIDRFRLLLASTPKAPQTPLHITPEADVSKQIKQRAEVIYKEFFGERSASKPKES